MISADVKINTITTTRNKRSGGSILPKNFHKKVPSKLEVQCKKQRHVFFI